MLEQSAALAGSRAHQVFTGIDIFGRGTYGGGGFTSSAALAQINRYKTSVALFAPGWTFERHGPSRIDFETTEDRFWTGKAFAELLENGDASEGNLNGWTVQNAGDGWKIDKDGFNGTPSHFTASYFYKASKHL